MKTLNLPNVTLCAISSIKLEETVNALKKSMLSVKYAEVILLTHEKLSLADVGINVIQIEKLDYENYSYFVLYKLKDFISTDFVLLVQHDGYVLHPDKWDDKFLNYDYIGAPWRKGLFFTEEGVNIRVGNGGFSLRSKKLLDMLSELKLPFTDKGTGFYNEDGAICVHYRKILEEHGIKYAPIAIASRFSRERWCSDSNIFTFGFHNKRRNFLKYLLNKFFRYE